MTILYKGVVYQVINIQNNKSYIGKTTEEFNSYKKRHLKKAIQGEDLIGPLVE